MLNLKKTGLLIVFVVFFLGGCIKATIPLDKTNFNNLTSGGKCLAPKEVAMAFHASKVTGDQSFEKGTEIAVLADQHCLFINSTASDSQKFFRKHLKNQKLIISERTSRHRTFGITLQETISHAQLTLEADTDPCVIGVGSSAAMTAAGMTGPDPQLPYQRQHASINSVAGWTTFFDPVTGINKDVVIAIVDTGVDIRHEDLKDNLWTNPGEIADNGIDDENNGFIDDVHGYNFVNNNGNPQPSQTFTTSDHGTHVAGLAAAGLNNGVGGAGVMGAHVKIMALNVFGDSMNVYPAPLDAGIRYAADNGANVINLSLGGRSQNDTDLAAIEYAIGKGVVIVAAAGNFGVDASFYPAGFAKDLDGMLSVASTDAVSQDLSSFSNFSPLTVQIAAPGSNGIVSTLPFNAYGGKEGTSMSSPLVAGAAGLAYGMILSRTNRLPKRGEIKKLLMSSSKKLPGLTNYVTDGNHLDLQGLARASDIAYPYNIALPAPLPNPPYPAPSSPPYGCPN